MRRRVPIYIQFCVMYVVIGMCLHISLDIYIYIYIYIDGVVIDVYNIWLKDVFNECMVVGANQIMPF